MDDVGVCQAGCGRSGTRSLSRCGLPRILGGSTSTTVLSGPAQGSPALRPVRLLQPKAHICPQAFTKEVSLPQCLGATGMYRQFPGRDFHPLVIWALVAHQYVGVDQFSVCPITEEGCFL